MHGPNYAVTRLLLWLVGTPNSKRKAQSRQLWGILFDTRNQHDKTLVILRLTSSRNITDLIIYCFIMATNPYLNAVDNKMRSISVCTSRMFTTSAPAEGMSDERLTRNGAKY